MREPLTFIDLFAGAGGFSLGLHRAGLKGIFAVERDGMAFSTLEHNLVLKAKAFEWPAWLPRAPMDIRTLLAGYRDRLAKLSGKVDLVVGGPPCQGFSLAGRRTEHDERNQMFREYLKFIEIARPSMVMFENVPGFGMPFGHGANPGKSYASLLGDGLAAMGYGKPEFAVLNFSDHGVPQNRKRLIMLASRDGIDPAFMMDRIRSSRKGRVTAREAISDLLRSHGGIPSPDSPRFMSGVYGPPSSAYQREMREGVHKETPDSHRFARHGAIVTERFTKVIDSHGGNGSRSNVRVASTGTRKRNQAAIDPEEPSPTLTTLPDDYVHYVEPRILTVREYARLQSFPDWFEFKGKYTTGGKLRAYEVPRYTQVANAVPPLFSFLLGSFLSLSSL